MRTRIEQEYKYSLSNLSLVNVLSSCTGHSAPTSPDPYSDKSFDLPEVDTVEQEEIVFEKKDSGILDIIGTALGPVFEHFSSKCISADARHKVQLARKKSKGTGNFALLLA